MTKRVRVVVRGRVQGVFFRDTLRREAARLGVAGWAENRGDGAVEAVFEGDEAGVDRMVALAHEGPERAVVEEASVEDEQPEGIRGFDVR